VGQVDDSYDSKDEGHGKGDYRIKTGPLNTFNKHVRLPESENNSQDCADDGNLVIALFQLTE